MVRHMSLSPKEWEGLVAEWRGSGMTRAEFCRQHGVAATALSYWVKRLELSGASAPKTKQVGVRAPESLPRTALARVVRPGEPRPSDADGTVRIAVGKAVVMVEPGFDDVHLRAVVRALSELA